LLLLSATKEFGKGIPVGFVTSLFIAIGLAMDAFAVSIGAGTGGQVNDLRSKLRLAFHFGLFQAGMTLIGWLAGTTVQRWISSIDHWVAFGLLAYVGVNMIRSGLDKDGDEKHSNPSKGVTMVFLSVATSIDALAVGISLAMISVPILFTSLLIGVVTFGLSLFGLMAGGKLGEKFGKRMEILGGVILIVIGLRVLTSHLFLI
jgi:putative Mn2+ efflux pump MntP